MSRPWEPSNGIWIDLGTNALHFCSDRGTLTKLSSASQLHENCVAANVTTLLPMMPMIC
jgi:hypothetical protein